MPLCRQLVVQSPKLIVTPRCVPREPAQTASPHDTTSTPCAYIDRDGNHRMFEWSRKILICRGEASLGS